MANSFHNCIKSLLIALSILDVNLSTPCSANALDKSSVLHSSAAFSNHLASVVKESGLNSLKSDTSKALSDEDLKATIEKLYNIRSEAFVNGKLSSLKQCFDDSQKYGKWSLEHEVQRVKYLWDWAKKRQIKFTKVLSTVKIKKVYSRSDVIKLALEESYKFDYIHEASQDKKINSFGIGIRHTLGLIKKNNGYIIKNDWYTDCFLDALRGYSGDINHDLTSSIVYDGKVKYTFSQLLKKTRPYYDRDAAIKYADKYCGAAWGNGNNGKYNKKYMDFNGAGGDCTNFASQAIGDKEGGNLPFDGSWFCSYPKYGLASGSHAWVNADGLKNYLVYSGKGSVIKRGTFEDLTQKNSWLKKGAVGLIHAGDLICYEKKDNVDHFAIVTAFDSEGYPLVNSHTTDRYHVPWDLGWGDKDIKFSLIHING